MIVDISIEEVRMVLQERFGAATFKIRVSENKEGLMTRYATTEKGLINLQAKDPGIPIARKTVILLDNVSVIIPD